MIYYYLFMSTVLAREKKIVFGHRIFSCCFLQYSTVLCTQCIYSLLLQVFFVGIRTIVPSGILLPVSKRLQHTFATIQFFFFS